MKRRFIAKRLDKAWRVYDVERGSFPIRSPEVGEVAQDHPTEAAAEREARRLEADLGRI